MYDRCVDKCTTASACALGEACLAGGCVPELPFIAPAGGDQNLWRVGFEEDDRDGGGCAVAPGAGTLLVAITFLLVCLTRRRPRR